MELELMMRKAGVKFCSHQDAMGICPYPAQPLPTQRKMSCWTPMIGESSKQVALFPMKRGEKCWNHGALERGAPIWQSKRKEAS